MPEIGLSSEVKRFCSNIGSDPLLVQGAGGNVSWKENGVLHVKASGKWLVNAEIENIFVSVSLDGLYPMFESGDFSVAPKVICGESLRPSIETLLHAMMPQTVVVHIHAVEILSDLVRHNCSEIIKSKVGDIFKWDIVDYCKPGEDLARAVFAILQKSPGVEVIFLKNHGLVIGGSSVEAVDLILEGLLEKFQGEICCELKVNNSTDVIEMPLALREFGYQSVREGFLNYLALNPLMASCVETKWALCPDHVVFLGSKPTIGSIDHVVSVLNHNQSLRPPYVFIKGVGVFQHQSVSQAQTQQLECYFEVVKRQTDLADIESLSCADVDELIHWEAEKYRQSVSI